MNDFWAAHLSASSNGTGSGIDIGNYKVFVGNIKGIQKHFRCLCFTNYHLMFHKTFLHDSNQLFIGFSVYILDVIFVSGNPISIVESFIWHFYTNYFCFFDHNFANPRWNSLNARNASLRVIPIMRSNYIKHFPIVSFSQRIFLFPRDYLKTTQKFLCVQTVINLSKKSWGDAYILV